MVSIAQSLLTQVQGNISESGEFYLETMASDKSYFTKAHFFANSVTRAVGAISFAIPAMMTGPAGVSKMPRLSARGSFVSSLMVSHRL